LGKKAFGLPKKLEYIEDHIAMILSDDIRGVDMKKGFGGLISSARDNQKSSSSLGGSISEMVELVSLAKRGVIKPVVSERFKLDQATEALSKLSEGKITGRGVINP
jgi:NADPH:quinone reductase-like Zn-dependent oxidoreductase